MMEYIIFIERSGNNEICVLDIETGEMAKMTGNLTDEKYPFWSS